MANLKEVRARISSVITTQQITKAMKLVAASKLRRAQGRILQMRPYANKLFDMMGNIMASIEGEDVDVNFSQDREVKNILVILVTSDRGLCGGFNSTLAKKTKQLLFEDYNDLRKSGNLKLMTIGKKGYDAFKKEEVEIITDHQDLFTRLTFENCSELAEYLMNSYLDGTYDQIDVVYSQFKNAATQIFTHESYLPIKQLESEDDDTMRPDFIFEPEKTQLVVELVPKILKTQFFRYLLDSSASEHGARMVAMDKATENADELLRDLKLVYNKERQAAITKEILEIVSGAAAMEEG